MEKNKHNPWIKIGISVLIIIVICTFLSRSIQTALSPQVEVVQPKQEAIPQELRTTGVVAYGESKTIFWPAEVKVKEVLVHVGQLVAKGDALIQIDLTQPEITRMEYENRIMELESSLSRQLDSKMTAELKGQLAITRKRYETFQSQYPKDGIIYSTHEGRIDFIGVEAGKSYPGQTTLMTIHPTDAIVRAEFTLSAEEALLYGCAGTIAKLQYSTVFNNSSLAPVNVEASMGRQVYDSTLQRYRCYIDIKNNPPEPGQRVDITLMRTSPAYDVVVPRSAVFNDNVGRTCVYLLDTRDSLFGPENYIHAVEVSIIAQNELKCAIFSKEVPYGAKVVASSTLPLTNNQTVVLAP